MATSRTGIDCTGIDCLMRKRDALKLVVRRIRRYGIRFNYGMLPAGFTGDLDGESITLDQRRLTEAQQLFTAAHLFGHTVQWNVSKAARALGLLEVKPPVKDRALLDQLWRYEMNAAEYAIQLLHEAGVKDLDLWFTNFTEGDVNYLMHYYSTGRKRPFRMCDMAPDDVLEARRIPSFTPKFRGGRNGVVI